MIADFHTHTFPDRIAEKAIRRLSAASHTVPFSDGTCAGLFSSMKRSGVDLSVILPVATAPGQVDHINDSAAEINRRWGGRPGFVSLGAIHPDCGTWRASLQKIHDLGLKGVKIHPVYQNADLDDVRYLRIMDRCAELGLMVVTHAGLDIGYSPDVVRCSPAMAAHVLSLIPGLTLVMAHMGGWKCWEEAASVLSGTSAYVDTAFSTGCYHPLDDGFWKEEDTRMLDGERFMKMIAAFGADRVLFGTDSPWSSQEESLSFLMALPLGEEDRRKILYENAAKLLGLSEDGSAGGA